MKTFKASMPRMFPLVALSLVLLGCPETNSPAGGPVGVTPLTGSPPQVAARNPSVDVVAIGKNLEGIKHGIRKQDLRIEEVLEAIRRLADKIERTRKDSVDAIEKSDKVVTKLREQIEKFANELKQLRPRSALAVEPKKEDVITPAGDVSKLPPAPRPPDPEEEFNLANRVLQEERNFPKARSLLKAFIRKYPKHGLADDAQYWIGQSYFQEKNIRDAILAFNTVKFDYANGDKAPDAFLMEALSHLEWGDTEAARMLLGELIDVYPDSSAAAAARKRLESL